MSDGKYVCMRCKCAGAKSLVPFKIIEDRDGEAVKFRGQLCEKCFNELMPPPQNTDDKNKQKIEISLNFLYNYNIRKERKFYGQILTSMCSSRAYNKYS